jgi:plasmid stabilization system protein ParE
VKRRVLSPPAYDDLERIQAYLTVHAGATAARRVLSAIRAASNEVFRHPNLGHYRNDLVKGDLRFWRVYSYLIVYRDDAHATEIIRFLHASRDIAHILSLEDE